MTNSTKTTKYSTIFLAAILVAGTFALSNSSFMVGAQAQQFNGMDQRYNNYEQDYGKDNQYNSYEPEYGMDSYDKQSYGKDSNSYDKSKDSNSVTVKKIKCNNINVNLNGFSGNEIGTAPTSGLDALATEAQAADEGEVGASTLGNGGGSDGGRPSGSDSDSRFVCINNNDNNVGGETPVTPEPPVDPCEDCFREFVTEQQISTYLFVAGTETLEEACDNLESPISEGLFRSQLADAGVSDTNRDLLIECLEGIGIVFLT